MLILNSLSRRINRHFKENEEEKIRRHKSSSPPKSSNQTSLCQRSPHDEKNGQKFVFSSENVILSTTKDITASHCPKENSPITNSGEEPHQSKGNRIMVKWLNTPLFHFELDL